MSGHVVNFQRWWWWWEFGEFLGNHLNGEWGLREKLHSTLASASQHQHYYRNQPERRIGISSKLQHHGTPSIHHQVKPAVVPEHRTSHIFLVILLISEIGSNMKDERWLSRNSLKKEECIMKDSDDQPCHSESFAGSVGWHANPDKSHSAWGDHLASNHSSAAEMPNI